MYLYSAYILLYKNLRALWKLRVVRVHVSPSLMWRNREGKEVLKSFELEDNLKVELRGECMPRTYTWNHPTLTVACCQLEWAVQKYSLWFRDVPGRWPGYYTYYRLSKYSLSWILSQLATRKTQKKGKTKSRGFKSNKRRKYPET